MATQIGDVPLVTPDGLVGVRLLVDLRSPLLSGHQGDEVWVSSGVVGALERVAGSLVDVLTSPSAQLNPELAPRIYANGRRARQQGRPLIPNPYQLRGPAEQAAHREWERGWLDEDAARASDGAVS